MGTKKPFSRYESYSLIPNLGTKNIKIVQKMLSGALLCSPGGSKNAIPHPVEDQLTFTFFQQNSLLGRQEGAMSVPSFSALAGPTLVCVVL
jgi:hypothetical protein